MVQATLVHCRCGHTSNAHALNFGRTRKHCLVKTCDCERFERCDCGRETQMGEASAHAPEPSSL